MPIESVKCKGGKNGVPGIQYAKKGKISLNDMNLDKPRDQAWWARS